MAGIKVRVNASRSEGNLGGDETNSILKDILKAIESGNNTQDKNAKISNSGLGGLTTGAIKGILVTVAGLLGMKALATDLNKEEAPLEKLDSKITNWIKGIFNPETDLANNTVYEKVSDDDGNEKVLKINEKTGEILETLTLEEAVKRGILDVNKNILEKYDTQNSIFDRITKNLANSAGSTMLAAANAETITGQTDAEIKLRTELLRLMGIEVLRQAQKLRVSTSDEILALGRGPISQSTAQQEAQKQAVQDSHPWNQLINERLMSSAPSQVGPVDLSYLTRKI